MFHRDLKPENLLES